MRLAALAAACLLLATGLATASGHLVVEQVAEDLDVPVALTFGPDGKLYFAELATGIVRSLDVDGTLSEPLATVPASAGGNGGFTGLSADPDEVGVFYAYYSMEDEAAPHGKVNRVVRLADGVEEVLLTLPWFEYHNGGRVLVGPDGLLYVTTGDNQDQNLLAGQGAHPDHPSQDPSSVLGKILRMDRSGQPAPDNMPGADPYVYAMGLRNVFGIAFDGEGRLFAADNGGYEEVNLIVRGGNYGWPECTGPCDPAREDLIDPVAWWDAGMGTTGVAIHETTLFMGDFNNAIIRTVELDTWETGVLWQSPGSPILDLAMGPDGCLYVSTFSAIYMLDLDGACDPSRRIGLMPDEPAPTDGDDLPDETIEGDPRASMPTVPVALVVVMLGLVAFARRR